MITGRHIFLYLSIFVSTCIGLCSCGAIPVEDRESIRQQLIRYETEILATFIEKDPVLQAKIDNSYGYFTGRLSGAKVPVIGGGKGMGVLYENETMHRSFYDVDRIDVGVGLGLATIRVLAVFDDRESLQRFKKGSWKVGISAESSLGSSGGANVYLLDGKEQLLVAAEDGVTLGASARLAKVSVNEYLTETGISEVNIPNTVLGDEEPGEIKAPVIWDRNFPFLAQRVVDLGYDLPLPYGIGLTYANVDQHLLIDKLQVGINGRDKEQFEFVSFENVAADSDSGQLKLDLWLFPFMNIFALLGHVDGKTSMDIDLDGNLMLEHLDLDCSGLFPGPICNALEDQEFRLPIRTTFSGKTYGIGTVLAGGWNDWFVAIPINFTYIDMDTTKTDGISATFTPRCGHIFNLGNWGNLSLFGGGNYLHTEYTVEGTVSTPDGLMTIDYTVEQDNDDKWNLLLGANWDISRKWSYSLEYNGFIGTREALVMSLNYRM